MDAQAATGPAGVVGHVDHATDTSALLMLAVLACATSIGGQFIIFGVPLFLRQAGAPSSVIGLFFLVGIPFVGRFLWAPLLDRRGSVKWGHYRGWVLGAQLLMIVLLGVLALLDPATSAALLLALLIPIAACLGTLSLALDALTVRLISKAEHARAITWQTVAAALAGLLLGGGVIWGFGGAGWTPAVLALAGLQTAALLLLLRAPLDRGAARPTARPFQFSSHLAVFRRPGIAFLFVSAALATLAADIPYAMKTVVLTDAGFDTANIGLIGIVGGNAAGLLAALAAQPLVQRLGGYGALVVIAGLSVLFSLVFVATGPHLGLGVATYVVATGAIVFAASVAVTKLLYDHIDPNEAATQTSTFAAVSGVLMIIVGGTATGLLDQVGLPAILIAGAVLTCVGGALCARYARKPE